MKKFIPLLLEVWREACRHIQINESVGRIAPLLARRLPADQIVLRRFDLARACVETLAASACRGGPDPEPTRTECSPEQLDAMVGWGHRGEVFVGEAAEAERRLPGLAPPGLLGSLLIVPLQDGSGASGALILAASRSDAFRSEHHAMAAALKEPFAVALANDRQLRELSQLREAAEAENRSLLSRLGRQDISDTVVGAETGLRSVMDRIRLVAASEVPVLLLGETGSGKEVAARAIHRNSRRASRPFLRVNCGAIPPELIDSELFGHERGSFTGASEMRKGWFERADGGTLFLDEVAELPAAAQVRLLRILQDGSFERVGGQQTRHADVRVVAATHRDLRAMVAEGTFREDLWYRIAVFVVRIPPLRERIEDIPSLATHFALRAAKRLGTVPLVPSPEENDLLIAYAWPGNARELSAVIERAAILGNGRRLEVAKALGVDAEGRVGTRSLPPTAPVASTAQTAPPAASFPTLDAVMIQHIEAALTATRGRVEGPYGAARLLDINPHTLRARMRKLGIAWKDFRSNGPQGSES